MENVVLSIIFFALQYLGVPYVAHTLEVNGKDNEQLIVNRRQLDCVTFVETALADYLVAKDSANTQHPTPNTYTYYLRMIRYKDGEVSYPTRNHYFSDWILNGEKYGFVKEEHTEFGEYIPKDKLNDPKVLKKYIHDGDILAFKTSKPGLDVSHVGFAHWHKDGTLHLLHASSDKKKVVDSSTTLYEYIKPHTTQLGVRVIHVL